MEIKIDSEAVNREIADAILKSTVGDQIRAALAETLKGRYGENPFTNIVAKVVHEKVAFMLCQEPYVSQIKDHLQKAITAETLSTLTTAAFDALLRRLEK